MEQYTPRNRIDLKLFRRRQDSTPIRVCEELVLKLDRDELFNPHVILPHAEPNEAIYVAVDQFVSRYKGDSLKLVIFCDALNEATMDTFREAYRMHYEDEYQKLTRYLRRRYIRAAILLLVSVLAYYNGKLLNNRGLTGGYLLNVLANVSVFCIWEIGYTHFTRSDASKERWHIARARDAVIEFQQSSKGKKSE